MAQISGLFAYVAAHLCLKVRAQWLVVAAINLLAVAAFRTVVPGSTAGGGGTPALRQPRLLLAAGSPSFAAPASYAAPFDNDDASKPFQVTPGSAAALVLAPLVSALSNAAGVGGGAVFVPLFCALLSMGVKSATALSQAVITGGAIGSVASSITRRHPSDPSVLLTDFDLALALLPPLLVGVAAGVLINIAVPAFVLTFLLIPLLVLFAIRTARTGLRLRRAEEVAKQRQAAVAPGTVTPQAASLQPCQQAGLRQHAASAAPKQRLELCRQGSGGAGADKGRAAAGATGAADGCTRESATPTWHIPAAGTGSTDDEWKREEEQQQHQHQHQQHQPATVTGCLLYPSSGEEGTADGEADKGVQLELMPCGSELLRWHDSPTLLDGVLECGPMHEAAELPAGQPEAGQQHDQLRYCSISVGEAPRLSTLSDSREPGSSNGSGDIPQFPWLKLAQMGLLWAAFLGFQLGKEHFGRCTWQFGLLFGLQASLALALSLLLSWQAVRGQAAHSRFEAQPILTGALPSSTANSTAGAQPGSTAIPSWTPRRLAVAWGVSLIGGTVAGVLGLGGGMVMAPLMIELGVHPASAAATSGLMVLFSSSTAVAAFAAAHRLNLAYAAVFGAACLVAALVGTFLVGRAVRRSGRASYLVLLLAGIIGLGALATAAFSGRQAVLDLVRGTNLHPPPFCG